MADDGGISGAVEVSGMWILLDAGVFVLCGLGVVFLVIWLLKYSGPAALSDCPARRNKIPFYLPFSLIIVWIVLAAGGASGARIVTKDGPEWLGEFVIYMVITYIEIIMCLVILYLAHYTFAQRLKGFGLSAKTIVRDFFAAVVNFIAVYPLVISALMLVMFAGRFAMGEDFEMMENEGLTAIIDTPYLIVKLLLFGSFGVVVPIFEEMLFRGMLQSMIRARLRNPWVAILISSVVFALMHPYWMHLPALFMLSLGMGYAYERSGSLVRPIFVHAIFNSASMTAALLT
jgi:membrane protease YdiL (CAAX protease family)